MKNPVFISRAIALLLCLSVVSGLFAEPFTATIDIEGTRLDDVEMSAVNGRLHVFGTRILPRIKRFVRKQRASRPQREHCDIIAQNRADTLGLNTRDQSGGSVNYNAVKVSTIYDGYPENRSSTPPAGTSGYYFSSYGNGMEHMGVYSRPAGTATYTRYMNRSFAGSETSATLPTDYIAPGSSAQTFVPLPRYESGELYYR